MYMVIFHSGDGKPGYHQAESLDEAVHFVERLRNQEQVPDTRIFRMTEVPLEFKTYIKVEVAGTAGEEAVAPVENGSPEGEPEVAEPPLATAGSPARFGRFRA